LFDTGYFWGKELQELIAQSFSETVAWLKERATDHEMTIVAGVGEPAAGGFYDSAILARPSRKLEIYRKTHLFRDEVKYFQAGDQLLIAGLEGAKLKIGTLICVELGFPELARALALEGASLVAIPMAFGSSRGPTIYETATRARTIENNIFLITANQVGRSGDFEFYGRSRVVSPLGEILLDLGAKEGCGVVELDLGLVKRCRRGEVDRAYPYLRERRPELYRRLIDRA
jgi:predicted amidohydrolase